MGQDTTLDIVIRLVVYGVPALLIILGFVAYASGYTMEMLTGDAGMKNLGTGLMVIGIVFYGIEFIIKVYDYFSEK